MTITTPEFQGTHLWDRLCWAKEKLEPHITEYCVVWEDPETPYEPAKITHPDPKTVYPVAELILLVKFPYKVPVPLSV